MGSSIGVNFGGWRIGAALRASGPGFLLIVAALLGGSAAAWSQAATVAAGNPDPTPILRIETGMHSALIRRIGADAQCRLLATGSDDKTVRLWSMPDGKLLRTQRLPIGLGHEGKIFAIAVSPDGRLVAAGGWDAALKIKNGHGVYVFDSATGTSVRRLGAFPDVVNHIAFSPDGKRLAVALNSGRGIRVLDVASGRELMSDPDFDGKSSYGIAFAADGNLFAVGFDGQLRRYGPDLKRTGRAATSGGQQPYSVAVDSAGQRLAVGFHDTPAVEIYDATTLRRIGAADTADVANIDFESVTWSRDGSRIFAGGTARDQTYHRQIRGWTRDGSRVGADVPVSGSRIFSLEPCGDAIAFGAGDPAFGLLRPDRTAVTLGRGRTVDMRGKLGNAFTTSDDGKLIRFGLGAGADKPVTFDLTRSVLADAVTAPAGLAGPKIDGLAVTDWTDAPAPRLAGQPIALEPYELSRSLAVRPDNTGFVLGADFYLHSFDAKGARRWEAGTPSETWGVNLARRGELVLAAFGDGTIRWYRGSDGKELLALFVDRESKAWVAWTPSGYYSASPGGEELIGWHVNRGWEEPADFFPAARFRDAYARPDIVERVLDTLDEAAAVRQANAARPGKSAPAPAIIERLPPVITILAPATGSTVSGESTRLDYVVRSPSGLPVDAVEALLNGRPAGAQRGFQRVTDTADTFKSCLSDTRSLVQGCRGSIDVQLPPGSGEVGLFARSGALAGDVVKISLTRTGAATAEEMLKPKLYALVVGISAYANADYNLGFAAKDARDFAAALENQKGGLYSEVTLRTLPDGAASASAIREGLDWLTRQVTSRDVGLVYLAGHGMLDERERFYFLAADSDVAHLRSTAVPREDIQDALNALAGKALLFLDACHAAAVAGASKTRGIVDINSVVNEFTRTERGVVVFTASTGRQFSQENSAWGNGAFTKAVIEGLGMPGKKAAADYRGDGKITTSALDLYVSERVKTLTGGTQSPVMIRPPTVPDFPIAFSR
jgi:WD40 repeat protein